jgi:hypothetical protein
MIKGVEQRYKNAQAEHKRLEAELSNQDVEGDRLEALQELRTTYLPAVKEWDTLPRERRRAIVRATIDYIKATPDGSHGLHLVIYWRDRSIDELTVARQSRTARDWLDSEIETLLSLVDREATQLEFAATFPDRNWQSIRHRLWKIYGQGGVDEIDPKPIHDHETYPMYFARISTRRHALTGSGERWRSDEEEQMCELVDSGSTQIEVAAAFPTRRWWRIRAKITKLYGRNVRIAGVGAIKRNETIFDYRRRQGEDITKEPIMTVHGVPIHQDYSAESHAL